MKHKCDGCRYKGEHREMMFRPFGICLRESNLIEAEKNYKAKECPYAYTKDFNDDKDKMFFIVGRKSDKMLASLKQISDALSRCEVFMRN